MNKSSQQGQGLLELVLALSVISIFLTTGIKGISQTLGEQHQLLETLRGELFQPLPSAQWQAHSNDAFSQGVAPFSDTFEHLIDVDFPTHNLKSVGHEDTAYVLARLTHAWQATSKQELSQRPAKLTATYHLREIGLSSLLNVVGYLPMAKELRSSSLRLGTTDADVVPESARCRDRLCR